MVGRQARQEQARPPVADTTKLSSSESDDGDDAMADPVGMPEGLRRAFPYTVFSRWSVDVDQATWDNVVKEALPHWTAAFMASLEELGENDNDDDRSGRW